jgi:hypothetical protein
MEKSNIVPSKDLCLSIPPKHFTNSFLVYRVYENGMYCISERDVLPRSNSGKVYPAPILPEIMEKLGNCQCVRRLKTFDDGVPVPVFNFIVKGIEYNTVHTNPAEAGLTIWLKINGFAR